MNQPGAIGYVLINFDGIPVMHKFNSAVKDEARENDMAVQYSALISDLVMKTKSTLNQLTNKTDSEFVYLRMRTKQDTELIVTDYITPGTNNEYILVCI